MRVQVEVEVDCWLKKQHQGGGPERHCSKEQQHNSKFENFLGGLFQGTASESVVVSRNNNNQTKTGGHGPCSKQPAGRAENSPRTPKIVYKVLPHQPTIGV